jgi:hypothetical protein
MISVNVVPATQVGLPLILFLTEIRTAAKKSIRKGAMQGINTIVIKADTVTFICYLLIASKIVAIKIHMIGTTTFKAMIANTIAPIIVHTNSIVSPLMCVSP